MGINFEKKLVEPVQCLTPGREFPDLLGYHVAQWGYGIEAVLTEEQIKGLQGAQRLRRSKYKVLI